MLNRKDLMNWIRAMKGDSQKDHLNNMVKNDDRENEKLKSETRQITEKHEKEMKELRESLTTTTCQECTKSHWKFEQMQREETCNYII